MSENAQVGGSKVDESDQTGASRASDEHACIVEYEALALGALPFESTERYEDIMQHRHPEPQGRAPLSASQRAAQFMPFAALTGFEALVQRTAQEQQDAVEVADTPVDGIEQGWVPA